MNRTIDKLQNKRTDESIVVYVYESKSFRCISSAVVFVFQLRKNEGTRDVFKSIMRVRSLNSNLSRRISNVRWNMRNVSRARVKIAITNSGRRRSYGSARATAERTYLIEYVRRAAGDNAAAFVSDSKLYACCFHTVVAVNSVVSPKSLFRETYVTTTINHVRTGRFYNWVVVRGADMYAIIAAVSTTFA